MTSKVLSCLARLSATPRTSANAARTKAVKCRLRNSLSMSSWKSRPSTPIGTVPTMTTHPILTSGSDWPTELLHRRARTHLETMRQMSLAK